MKRVKILSGFNPDLIGKEATVVNEQNDGMIEVIVKGRESMRYTIPANTVYNLDAPTVEKVVKVENDIKKESSDDLKFSDDFKVNVEKLIKYTERFLNELKDIYGNSK